MHVLVHIDFIGFTRIDPQWAFTHRESPFWRLYHDWDPGAAIEGRNGRMELAPGGILLIPAGWTFHAVPPARPARHLFIHFSIACPDQRLPPAPVAIKADPGLRALLGEGHDGDWGPGDDLRACALVYQSLAQVVRPAEEQDLSLRDRLTRHIRENLHSRLSVCRLAAMTGYTADHYIRLFAQHLGVTPARYIAGERLTLARHLLTTTRLPLETVAARCGFASRRHMGVAFKRAGGITPSAFRAAAAG